MSPDVRAREALVELGPRWTVPAVDALLRRGAELPAGGARVLAAARALVGTPFLYEPHLPVPPRDHVRVRLATLDCYTFVLTALAMGASSSWPELTGHLARLRYLAADGDPLDSDPSNGNILGIASEVFLHNAVERGYLEDITAAVAGGADRLTELQLDLHERSRPRSLDPLERHERPLFGGGRRAVRLLAREHFGDTCWAHVRDGDVVALTKGPTIDGAPNFDFINHLTIAEVAGGEVYFLHATRHFAWTPAPAAAAAWTGVFYDAERRCEQIGVGPAGFYGGEQLCIRTADDLLHGYDMSRRRSLRDYAASNFAGAFVLRPRRSPATGKVSVTMQPDESVASRLAITAAGSLL